MRCIGWGWVDCKHQPWLLFCPLLSWRQAGAGGGRRRFPALCRSLAAPPQLQAPVPPVCPHDTGWGRSWCQHLCTHHQPQVSSCARIINPRYQAVLYHLPQSAWHISLFTWPCHSVSWLKFLTTKALFLLRQLWSIYNSTYIVVSFLSQKKAAVACQLETKI